MFTIDESAALLDTAEITWLGKPCKLTAVSVATMAQLRANWPAPVAPTMENGERDYASPIYQARLMADQKEMGILELAAAIDLSVTIGYTVNTGPASIAKNPAPMALSEVLVLPENEIGAANEAWCKEAMRVLGGMAESRLEPLRAAYEKLATADVAAGAAGN